MCARPRYKALHQFYAFAALQNRPLAFDFHSYIFPALKIIFLLACVAPTALCLKHFLLLFFSSSPPSPNTSLLQSFQNLLAPLFLHYQFDKPTQNIIMPELRYVILLKLAQMLKMPFPLATNVAYSDSASVSNPKLQRVTYYSSILVLPVASSS